VTSIIVGTLVIVAITIAVGLLINRKVPLLPGPEHFDNDKERERKQRTTHGAGEAPGRGGDAARIRQRRGWRELTAIRRAPPDGRATHRIAEGVAHAHHEVGR
jgi:hypothetical protein